MHRLAHDIFLRRGGIIVENYFDNPPLLWRTPATINPRRFFIPPSLQTPFFSPVKMCLLSSSFIHRSPESPTFRSRCNRRQLTTCKPRFIRVDLSVSGVHQKEKNDLLLAPLIYRPSGAERFSLMPPRTPLRLSCYTGIRLIADWSPRIEDIPSMVDETRDPMKCWL